MPSRNHRLLSLLLILLLQPVVPQKPDQLELTDVSAGSMVGCSTTIMNDLAVVGSCGAPRQGHLGAGTVHTLRVSTRENTGLVVPPSASAQTRFGSAVELGEYRSNGLLFVGAPGEGSGYYKNVGFVYIFQFSLTQEPTSENPFDYSYKVKLFAEDAGQDDHFGSSISMHGDRVAVGAPGPSYYPAGFAKIDDGGAVYIFDLATNEQLAKLQPRDRIFMPLIGCYGFGTTVALTDGLVAVGAPRAKPPCSAKTKNGAAFTFLVPPDGYGLKARDTPWWWGQGGTYNQTSKLVPPEDEFQIEFGMSVAIAPTVWDDGPQLSVLAIGAPGVKDDLGAVYLVGPINTFNDDHEGRRDMIRVLGPTYLQGGARFGSSISIDKASSYALVGAPGAFTKYGKSGAAVRTWLVRDSFSGQRKCGSGLYAAGNMDLKDRICAPSTADPGSASAENASAPAPLPLPVDSNATQFNSTDLNGSMMTFPPAAPPPPPALPLQEIEERLLWAPDGEPGDTFGFSVALGPGGHSLVGALFRDSYSTDANVTLLVDSGAMYMFEPTVSPPSTPPPPPLPPKLPPSMPSPPLPPPFGPPDYTPAIVGSSFGAVFIVIPVFILYIMSYVAPKKYRRYTRHCRKPMKELTGDSGRGPVADQLRAILAKHAFAKTPADLFKAWDKDRGGTVSRKEFRIWWPKVGYEIPIDDLNNLFDEFDVDGSGEIDVSEFTNAFDQKGQLWKELEEAQNQFEDPNDLLRLIDQLTKNIARKQRTLAMEQAAVRWLDDAQLKNQSTLDAVEAEIVALTKEREIHQARLDAVKGAAKNVMAANRAVNAFKSMLTPDEAAIAIQSKVRGRSAAKMVQEKKRAAGLLPSRPATAEAPAAAPAPAPELELESDELPDGWQETVADDGQVYYYNEQTRQTSLASPKKGRFQPPPENLPAGWLVASTAEGEQYYYNEKTLETSWTLPKVIKKVGHVIRAAHAFQDHAGAFHMQTLDESGNGNG